LFELENMSANSYFSAQAVQNYSNPFALYPQGESIAVIQTDFYGEKPFSELLSSYSVDENYKIDANTNKIEDEQDYLKEDDAKKSDKTAEMGENAVAFLNYKEVLQKNNADFADGAQKTTLDFDLPAGFKAGFTGKPDTEIKDSAKTGKESAGEEGDKALASNLKNKEKAQGEAAGLKKANQQNDGSQSLLKQEIRLKQDKSADKPEAASKKAEAGAEKTEKKEPGEKPLTVLNSGNEPDKTKDAGVELSKNGVLEGNVQNKKQKDGAANAQNAEKPENIAFKIENSVNKKTKTENQGEKSETNGKNQDKKKLSAEKTRIKEHIERETRLQDGKIETVTQIKSEKPESGGAHTQNEVEITVNLKTDGQNAPQDGQPLSSFRAEQSLENFLSRELHQDLNGDIVRQANIMLRSAGEGTIKLALHPASLGNVKIRLELNDNKITGKVTVESKEALRAFQGELESLTDAFKAQGFESASLDMQLADSGNGAAENAEAMKLSYDALLSGYKAARYDENIDSSSLRDVYSSLLKFNQVNVFA